MDLLNWLLSRSDTTLNPSRYHLMSLTNRSEARLLPSKVKENGCKVSRIFCFSLSSFLFVSDGNLPPYPITQKELTWRP
jgi:hypothetical protein